MGLSRAIEVPEVVCKFGSVCLLCWRQARDPPFGVQLVWGKAAVLALLPPSRTSGHPWQWVWPFHLGLRGLLRSGIETLLPGLGLLCTSTLCTPRSASFPGWGEHRVSGESAFLLKAQLPDS